MARRQSYRRRTNAKIKRQAQIYKKHTSITLTGRFLATSVGGVFFELNEDGTLRDNKYFVEQEESFGAINGDTVKVKVLNRRRDVRVIEIIERSVKTVIGTYNTEEASEESYVEPDNTKLRFAVLVVGNESGIKANDGDKVEVRLIYYPERRDDIAEGIITEVFGDSCSREANYSAILHQSGIVTKFSSEALEIAAECGQDIPIAAGRTDFRGETVFTIDGADAKDLDDAISVKRNGDGYILGVHIADVSNYVKENTQLDKEAMERGTSVYFSDKVVPMLPETLSNGICSLNSGLDRYTLSVIISVDKFGEIKDIKPCKAIINSRVRGVYTEVNALIDGKADAAIREKYAPILDGTLDTALELYSKLKEKSERRGVLDIESAEAKIILDENGEPCDIIRRERGVAERLIEQFMLCANEAIASYLTKKALPCVYRIHEKPDNEKVVAFVRFAHNLKLEPPYCKKENVSPAYFGGILEKAKKKGVGFAVSSVLLRSMQKAKYSEKNAGHFGLSSTCYCHFTSPIRRYPDLAVHRILTAAITEEKRGSALRYTSFAAKAAKKSSDAELRALEAERAIDDLYKTLYMSKNVGKEFDAVISSVNSFGLFCMLDNTCEGLVPTSTMRGRVYYDHESMTLTCEKRVYHIGDAVKIRVEKVDIPAQLVDFSIVCQ